MSLPKTNRGELGDDKLRPLLIRSPLLPDESLPFYLLRLSKLNGYDVDSRDMVRSIALRHAKRNSVEFLASLSLLTCLSEAELYAATYHRWTDMFQQDGIGRNINGNNRGERYAQKTITLSDDNTYSLLPEAIRRWYLWPESNATYCPLCLQDNPYHRLHWFSVGTAVCLEHKILLAQGCPQCSKAIPLYSLLDCLCPNCGYSLCDTPTQSVAHDALGLSIQAVLQSWWGQSETSIPVNVTLPDKDTKTLFSIIYGLRKAVLQSKGYMATFHNPGVIELFDSPMQKKQRKKLKRNPTTHYATFATASKGLLNWPNGFYDFLDAYRHRLGRKPTGDVQVDFSTFYVRVIEKQWQARTFDFVQRAFEDFIVENHTLSPSILHMKRYQKDGAFRERFPEITITEAAQTLNVSPETVKVLIDNGSLSKLRTVERRGKGRFILVLRDEVVALSRVWGKGKHLEEMSKFLGVSNDIVVALADLDLLQTLRKPTDDGALRWLFVHSSAIELQKRLKQIADDKDNRSRSGNGDADEQSWLLLTEATQMLSIYRFNAAMIIQSVLNGELRVRWSGSSLHQLELLSDDVESLRERLYLERERFSRRQVAEMLSVKPRSIQRWIEIGLIEADVDGNGATWITKENWLCFRESYIFSHEAVEILGVSLLTVQKWAQNGRLHSVCGGDGSDLHRYLFRREEVKKLAPDNRMTTPQLAKEMGLSRSHMTVWIKEGKVKPVSGPGIDGMRNFLFLRSELRDKDSGSMS